MTMVSAESITDCKSLRSRSVRWGMAANANSLFEPIRFCGARVLS